MKTAEALTLDGGSGGIGDVWVLQEGHEFFIIETGSVVCTKTVNGRNVEVCDPLGEPPIHCTAPTPYAPQKG